MAQYINDSMDQEPVNEHEKAVKSLSDEALRCVIHDLRNSRWVWAIARRMAAIDEADKRGLMR